MEVFGYLGVDMRWLRSSTAIRANVLSTKPIKGELIVDPSESKVVIKCDPPRQSEHLLTAKVEPVNLIVYVPKSPRQLPFEYEMTTLYSRENVRSVTFEVSQLPRSFSLTVKRVPNLLWTRKVSACLLSLLHTYG